MAEASDAHQLTPELLTSDFRTAANAVLSFLHARLGFGLWMVTRVDGNAWTVLEASDHGYDVSSGDLFAWSDSFCSRMIAGQGPRIACDSDLVPAYVEAPIGRQVPIRAYVGVPIQAGDELFGTLCAINPSPVPDAIVGDQPLVELLAGLLGNILLRERVADETRREAERAAVEAHSDSLTGLMNRRGWEELLRREEARAERYGEPALLFVIDLDDLKLTNDNSGHAAGDVLLRRAAEALRGAMTPSEVLARLGGDEFGVIAVSSNASELEAIRGRLTTSLTAVGVKASVGGAARRPGTGLSGALSEADQRMFAEKRARKRAATAA
ncbi:MAG: diguanylate cyclase [Chloroflexi bacterium]|nr:diguanylate cyclase [Chloroflexota bacterium]